MVYIERSITPYVQKAEKNFKAHLMSKKPKRTSRLYLLPVPDRQENPHF